RRPPAGLRRRRHDHLAGPEVGRADLLVRLPGRAPELLLGPPAARLHGAGHRGGRRPHHPAGHDVPAPVREPLGVPVPAPGPGPAGGAWRGCERRVGRLYLPPGERAFGCRSCYNLTYRSTQTSGTWLARLLG